jgi:hypothetical protein
MVGVADPHHVFGVPKEAQERRDEPTTNGTWMRALRAGGPFARAFDAASVDLSTADA